jgi:hypothetical protein
MIASIEIKVDSVSYFKVLIFKKKIARDIDKNRSGLQNEGLNLFVRTKS